MTMQPERLYFAAPDANSTETRQAIAVVQYSVVTSRASRVSPPSNCRHLSPPPIRRA